MTDEERQKIADWVLCIIVVDMISRRKFPTDDTVEKAKDFIERYNQSKVNLDELISLMDKDIEEDIEKAKKEMEK